VTEDELAAVIAALQAVQLRACEPPQPETSAWRRTARLEAIDVQ
jgi:hypothetical protein